ncbi:hypothetical protein ACFQZ4_06865 [Catellatospora coxensis]
MSPEHVAGRTAGRPADAGTSLPPPAQAAAAAAVAAGEYCGCGMRPLVRAQESARVPVRLEFGG